MKIGDRIKALRETRGIQQQELCSILGVEQSTLANYENNRRIPNDDIKSKIADYFHVTIDYLLGREVEDSFYSDPEIDEAVNAMHKDPELKVLFNATKGLKKEDLEFVINLVTKMK